MATAGGEGVTPAALPIFLSCGTPHTKLQKGFISAIEAHLKSHGCIPQTVGRSSHSVRQPVEAARNRIDKCRGAVIIAFERTRIVHGVEKPDSPEEKKLHGESHPTVWNQMEAAMAYARQVPILTFVQKGLKRQGMLSDRFEWKAIETDLSLELLRTEEFQQVFQEWIDLVRTHVHARIADFDPAEMTIGALLSQLAQLKTKQVWKIVVIVSVVLTAVATTAFRLGQAFPSASKDAQQAAPAAAKKSSTP